MTKRFYLTLATTITAAAFLVGCESMGPAQRHRATSLYDYLYPNTSGHVDAPTIPVLSLPLKVGIAFVPIDNGGRQPHRTDLVLSEDRKMELMKAISDQFRAYPFVKSIELVPTTYLTPKGGFGNLQQIRAMYGVDVMALLSYDQIQFTDQGLLSLTYWTIIGGYIVQGEKNDTRTMLDAAVYDIASRKLLFRAPGTSTVKASATPVNLSEELRKDSELGFEQAATNLVPNVRIQLEAFQERVKSNPTEYKVVHREGYTGAGSVGATEAAVIAIAGACLLWQRRRTK
jgi:rhombotail lipoprotein